MSDEQAAMDEVGRYWDAVARGDGATNPAIDPALARTIHRVHGLATPPPVGARERVWQTVLVNAEAARRQEAGSMLRVLVPNGRTLDLPGVGIPGGGASGPQRAFLAQLATAALILLTLIGSFMVFGPGRISRQEQPSVFIPAIEATPATPEADEKPVVEFLWQSEGDPAQPLDDPVRVAIDPQGNIWVNDGQHGRFQIFAPDGAFLEVWGSPGTGDGQFDFVGAGLFGGYGGGGMAFDADGNLYVADPGNNRIQKFGPDRAFITSWGSEGQGDGQFSAVTDVAVDAQGRVFVTDEGRDDVQVFDVDGNFLTSWGDPDEGWLPQPSGLTIDADGNLWIAHFTQNRVQKYTPDGTLLATVGEYGRGPGQFGNPSDVAVDSLGHVYVADWGGAQVQVFDAQGGFLAAWGELGLDEGQFVGLNNAVPDGAGNVYVTEDGNDRLQKFRLLPPFGPSAASDVATPIADTTASAPVAELLWQSTGDPDLPLNDPYFLTLDPDGNLWVPDGLNSRFQIFSPDGDFLETWGEPGSGDGQFDFVSDPYGVGAAAFDAEGNVYVADHGNGRIQKFGSDRSFLAAWDGSESEEGRLIAPLDIAISADGNVFVSDVNDDYVKVFDRDGRYLYRWGGLGADDGEFMEIAGLTVDDAGHVWVVDAGEHRVQKFDSDGAFLAKLGAYGSGEGEFRDPNDVTVDARGRVYATDWENYRVQVFDGDGQFLGAWGEQGEGEGQFQGPAGIVLDAQGNAYVSDDGIDDVLKFRLMPPLGSGEAESTATPVATDGAIAEIVWETRGGPDLPLSYPGYLALDPNGNLWIPDSGNDRYQIFSPDGEFIEAWGETGSGEGQFEFEVDLWHSSSIAFAPDGSFYVTDPGNFRVQNFGPDRAFVTSWGEQGSGPGQFDLMNGIAVDGEGRVYVTDDGRSDVQVFDADGAYSMTIGERGFNDGQFMFSTGSAVTFDDAGNVWVADATNHRIQTFSPEGDFLSLLSGGPREDELSRPNQLAIDGEGRLFVAAPERRQVQVFAADGTYLGALGTANPTAWAEGDIPPGQFLTPSGVVLDGAGNLYVADYEDYRVQKFRLLPPLAPLAGSPEAVPATAETQVAELVWQTEGGPGLPLDGPYKPTIDPAGNLWVPDGRNHRFQIFTPDGEFLESWGIAGSGDEQFDFELGGFGYGAVVWDADGNFYVADPGNHRIQKFAPDRTFVAAWGSEGMNDGQFMGLEDLVLDEEGRLYASDGGRDDIQIFDHDGTFLDSWSGTGTETGQFLTPTGITVDGDGNLYISEYEGHRIQKVSPDGAPIAVWGAFGREEGQFINPVDASVDAQGRVYIAELGNNRVQVFDANGGFLATRGGRAGVGNGLFDNPNGATLDGEGFIYVSDEGSDTVLKFRLLPPLAPE